MESDERFRKCGGRIGAGLLNQFKKEKKAPLSADAEADFILGMESCCAGEPEPDPGNVQPTMKRDGWKAWKERGNSEGRGC